MLCIERLIPLWYIYLLLCFDNTIYCGISNNVDKRIADHNKGKGAKYTKTRTPVSLIRSFEAGDKSSALHFEYKIKQLWRKDKLKVIGVDIKNDRLVFQES